MTTPDVRLDEIDLADPVIDKIDQASEDAADAKANANAALAQANETAELVGGAFRGNPRPT